MFEKYKWKNRILLIKTSNYKNLKYKKIKSLYQNNIKKFHKRYVLFKTKIIKQNNFSIKLIGFDGNVKKIYKSLIIDQKLINNILKTIDNMPMEKQKIIPKTAKNLSLYSDYNPKTTIPGLGYKNPKKAKYTIHKIKNKSIKYQLNTLNT